jgi:hypothetical protein
MQRLHGAAPCTIFPCVAATRVQRSLSMNERSVANQSRVQSAVRHCQHGEEVCARDSVLELGAPTASMPISASASIHNPHSLKGRYHPSQQCLNLGIRSLIELLKVAFAAVQAAAMAELDREYHDLRARERLLLRLSRGSARPRGGGRRRRAPGRARARAQAARTPSSWCRWRSTRRRARARARAAHARHPRVRWHSLAWSSIANSGRARLHGSGRAGPPAELYVPPSRAVLLLRVDPSCAHRLSDRRGNCFGKSRWCMVVARLGRIFQLPNSDM